MFVCFFLGSASVSDNHLSNSVKKLNGDDGDAIKFIRTFLTIEQSQAS